MAKVHAYRKDTGERVTIPESWLDHPTLGEPFRKTKPGSTSSTNQAPAKPATASTTKEK